MKASLNELKNLGLSPVAIQTYNQLLDKGAMTVSKLARSLDTLPQSLYRIIVELEEKGFITEIGDYPQQFQARPLANALDHYLEYQKRLVESLKPETTRQRSLRYDMRILIGRKEILDTRMSLMPKARKELLTLAIGKSTPAELFSAYGKAISRGVKSYIIYQVHTNENDFRMRRWQSQGNHLRILPGEGFHLATIDDKYAVLSTVKVSNSKERTGVLISSPAIVNELRKYFFYEWGRAQPLGSLKTID